MLSFYIHINHGDDNKTVKYNFVHKQWDSISEKEQNKAFDDAIKELNRIYKTYGRFATEVGILRLFDHFGFELRVK